MADPAPDDRDVEPRTPMKRLGSTRKLAAFTNIRVQLSEQSRVLEARAEAASGVAAELADYCRRRAELEHEYSRALDKLQARQEDSAHRREAAWSGVGAFSCWSTLLEQSRALSRSHAALAALYAGPLATRLQRAAADVARLQRKCKDIVSERHEEVGAALAEAAAAGKAHAAAAAEWRAAALKLARAHERLAPAQGDAKKLAQRQKEKDKRVSRHSAARARALRARAEYVLALEAANATLQRYYLDDVADIMMCMETGYEALVGAALRGAGAGEAAAAAAGARAGAALAAARLDAAGERAALVAAHRAAFSPPRPLPHHGPSPQHQDEEMRTAIGGATGEADAAGDSGVRAELCARLAQLEAAARELRALAAERAKTCDAAERELLQQMEGGAVEAEVEALFSAEGASEPEPRPEPRKDQEDYYLQKFREYISCAGRLARLESKAARLAATLAGSPTIVQAPGSPPRRAPRARAAPPGSPSAAPDAPALPTVLTACVRVISKYGMKQQGLFRVSGSQVEMQALRAAYLRGEDPLSNVRGAADIHTVCGLLKMHLREQRGALLPARLHARLLAAAALPEPAATRAAAAALRALPAPALLQLRYLCAFLQHVTEYSAYNMMDSWNLAICVGPALLAAPGGAGQLAAQTRANQLVQALLLRHKELFPQAARPDALYRPATPSDDEGEAESCEQDGDSAPPAPEGDDDTDARDDLSLNGDHDDDTDEISEDEEPAEWEGDNVTEANGAPPQASEPEPSAAPAASAQAPCSRLADTPDLVLDLPLRAADPPAPVPAPAEPPLPPEGDADPPAPAPPPATPPTEHPEPAGTADTFLHNRDTLKKRPQHKPSLSEGDAHSDGEAPPRDGEGEGAEGDDARGTDDEASGSPVPARNTARVAAKFASLTLTGGSLVPAGGSGGAGGKPALAAKPALLRRPTPHPRH